MIASIRPKRTIEKGIEKGTPFAGGLGVSPRVTLPPLRNGEGDKRGRGRDTPRLSATPLKMGWIPARVHPAGEFNKAEEGVAQRGAGDLPPGVWGCPPDSKAPQEWGIQGVEKGFAQQALNRCFWVSECRLHCTGKHAILPMFGSG